VLRGLLRFIAYFLAFWFVYRVVVGAFRHIMQDSAKKEEPGPRPPSEPKEESRPDYRDVKDARYTDLPKDDSKPS
jgi:flagellar biosynthesis/type III secretory pathway M-ring protein FliF/YscJ